MSSSWGCRPEAPSNVSCSLIYKSQVLSSTVCFFKSFSFRSEKEIQIISSYNRALVSTKRQDRTNCAHT